MNNSHSKTTVLNRLTHPGVANPQAAQPKQSPIRKLHALLFASAALLLPGTGAQAATAAAAKPLDADNPIAQCYHSAFHASRAASTGEYLNDTQLYAGVRECTQALRHYNLRKKARSQVYLHRGLLNRHLLRGDLALRDFKRAQRVAGDSPAISVNIGNVYYLKGDFNRAIGAYQRALQMDFPAAHKALLNSGLANEQLGRQQHAIDAYVAALALEPSLQVARERLVALTHSNELLSQQAPATGYDNIGRGRTIASVNR